MKEWKSPEMWKLGAEFTQDSDDSKKKPHPKAGKYNDGPIKSKS
jgi:hypothetical protein